MAPSQKCPSPLMSQPARPVFDTMAAHALLKGKAWSVAMLAKHMGLTRQAVGHWFRGRGEPDVRQLKAMADKLGCHWLELVTEEATVLYQSDEIGRVQRIRELDAAALAELDAFLAFKAAKRE